LVIGFTCGVGDADVGNDELRDDVLGLLTGCWPVGLPGPLAGSAGVLAIVAGELVRVPPASCPKAGRGSRVVLVDERLKAFDGAVLLVDEDADDEDELEDDELDELEPDGSANATPGMVATADPTPSATANAPTRPT
jgi:hypothetical protein